ncbi:hypothetical protein GEMRC1_012868 [Eukaryota sp. GEM-RC1]
MSNDRTTLPFPIPENRKPSSVIYEFIQIVTTAFDTDDCYHSAGASVTLDDLLRGILMNPITNPLKLSAGVSCTISTMRGNADWRFEYENACEEKKIYIKSCMVDKQIEAEISLDSPGWKYVNPFEKYVCQLYEIERAKYLEENPGDL